MTFWSFIFRWEFPITVSIALSMWLPWIFAGGYVAQQKRRSVVEGRVFGLLGPIGVVIEALLPTNIHAPLSDAPQMPAE